MSTRRGAGDSRIPLLKRWGVRWGVALLVLAGLAGCKAPPPGAPEALVAEAERGPFAFQVAVSPKAPRVGEPIRIELTARTPADYAVAFPADDALTAATGFEIVAAELPQSQALPDGGLEWSRTITAEAYLSGEVEIPALALRYGRRAGGAGSPSDRAGDPGPPSDPARGPGSPSGSADGSGSGAGELAFEVENELITEPLKLTIVSALTSQDAVTLPRDITGPVVPPRPPLSAWQWAALIAGALLGLGLIAVAVRWLHRWAHRPAPPVPAEVAARRALDELDRDEWRRPERVRAYYYRLSEIVRAYIEAKFGVHAAEMTTEEFIRAVAGGWDEPEQAGLAATGPAPEPAQSRGPQSSGPQSAGPQSSGPHPSGAHSGGDSGRPHSGGAHFAERRPRELGAGAGPDEATSAGQSGEAAVAIDRAALLEILRHQRERLVAFMESCDIVKYGALAPGAAEAQHALSVARGFVDETAAAVAERQRRLSAPQVAGSHAA